MIKINCIGKYLTAFILFLSIGGTSQAQLSYREIKMDVLHAREWIQSNQGTEISITNTIHALPGTSGEIITNPVAMPLDKVNYFISLSLKAELINMPLGACRFYIRTSTDNQTWSNWQACTKDEHAYSDERDIATNYFYSTPQEISTETKSIQLKINFTDARVQLSNIRLNFFSPGQQTDKSNGTAVLERPASCPCPSLTYVTRTGWGCPEGQSSGWTPVVTTVTNLVVHHAAGYGSAPYGPQVLGIWNQHAITQAWGDIGYNWLIAPDGTLYQGRAWSGINDNVIGAHMCACNSNKMGVCFLGDLTSTGPTTAAYNTLVKLLSWKACSYGVNPLTSTTVSYNPNNSGCVNGTILNIIGHRDGCQQSPLYTTCPGTAFYPQLATLRTDVQNYITTCGAGCPQPLNDGCAGSFSATQLPFGTTCTTISGSTCGATSSGFSSCSGTQDDDVFYRFTPTSNNATITVTSSPGFDAVFQVLTGPCGGSMTQLACVDETLTGGTETFTLNNLISGTEYFVRVWHSGTGYGTSGDFTICAYGTVCTVPGTQAVISATTPGVNQITVNLTPGNGIRRIVKANTTNNFTDPSNGTDPAAAAAYAGSGEQVVYNGTGNSVVVTGLLPSTNYCFKVYEANCNGTQSLYNMAGSTAVCQSTTFPTALPPAIDQLESFSIIPNPNTGKFSVKMKLNTMSTVSFRLYTMSGQLMLEKSPVRWSGERTIMISPNNLPAGSYQLETKINEQVFMKSFIVLH